MEIFNDVPSLWRSQEFSKDDIISPRHSQQSSENDVTLLGAVSNPPMKGVMIQAKQQPDTF